MENLILWRKRAIDIGATHIISVCDAFSYEDYPVYVMPEDDLLEKKKQYHNINMQRINKIINIT